MKRLYSRHSQENSNAVPEAEAGMKLPARRQFVRLGVAAGLGLGAAGVAAQHEAGPAGRPGPLVWMDYDQARLDAAYDQQFWAGNMQSLLRRTTTNSQRALAHLPPRQVWAYGTQADETIEGFLAPGKHPAPIHVFVHGGAWRGGAASDAAFMAENFVGHGVHFLALNFSNILDVNGNLMAMADQVRRALAWIARNAATFGGDPSRLYLSGFSSGAHLAGVLLTTDWAQGFGLPQSLIRGAVCISGIYELKPARLSARRKYVAFTDEIEAQLSPQRHVARIQAPVALVHGSLESPEFMRQSRDFASALEKAGKKVSLSIGEEYNHFEIAETLASPYGIAGRLALAQVLGEG